VQFFLIPNNINEFVDLKIYYLLLGLILLEFNQYLVKYRDNLTLPYPTLPYPSFNKSSEVQYVLRVRLG